MPTASSLQCKVDGQSQAWNTVRFDVAERKTEA